MVGNAPSGLDWPKWLMFYAAASFAVYGTDAAINHLAFGPRSAIAENALAYTPLIFAPLAVVACLLAFAVPRWRPALAWVTGALAVVVGATGMGIHLLENIENAQEAERALTAFALSGPAALPFFAPAAFAATGIVVLLVGIDARLKRIREA